MEQRHKMAESSMIKRINKNTIIETISPGKFRAIIGVRNYKADTGKWEAVIDDIKTNLTLVGSKIGVDKVNLRVRFPETLNAPLRVFDRRGNRADILFKGLAFRNIKTGDLTYLSGKKNSPEVTIDGSWIHYNEIYIGIRLSYQQRDESIKEEVTISEATRASLNSPYPVEDTHLVIVSQITNVVGIIFPLGTYSFRDVEFSSFPLQRYEDGSLIIDGVEFEKVLDVTNFPGDLTIDPTATLYDDDTDRGNGIIGGVDTSTYLASRSSGSGSGVDPSYYGMGQQFASPNYYTIRGYSNFDLSGIPGGATITSATLDLYGTSNFSATDFDYGIYDSGQPGVLVVLDYSSFPGWLSSSQTYTPTAWGTAKLNSSTYMAGYGNVFTFNATGKTAIEANIGGEFQVLLLSDEDINYSAATGNEFIYFGNSASANKTKLIVNYTVPVPSPPTNVAATDGTYHDKVTITWTKSSGATNYKVYRNGGLIANLGDVAIHNDTGGGAPIANIPTGAGATAISTSQIDLAWTDGTISNGTTYSYTVSASNDGSNYSSQSTGNTGYRADTFDTHEIKRGTTDGGNELGTVTDSSSPYNHTGLDPGTIYFYEIRTKSTNGYVSSYTSSVNATTFVIEIQAISAQLELELDIQLTQIFPISSTLELELDIDEHIITPISSILELKQNIVGVGEMKEVISSQLELDLDIDEHIITPISFQLELELYINEHIITPVSSTLELELDIQLTQIIPISSTLELELDIQLTQIIPISSTLELSQNITGVGIMQESISAQLELDFLVDENIKTRVDSTLELELSITGVGEMQEGISAQLELELDIENIQITPISSTVELDLDVVESLITPITSTLEAELNINGNVITPVSFQLELELDIENIQITPVASTLEAELNIVGVGDMTIGVSATLNVDFSINEHIITSIISQLELKLNIDFHEIDVEPFGPRLVLKLNIENDTVTAFYSANRIIYQDLPVQVQRTDESAAFSVLKDFIYIAEQEFDLLYDKISEYTNLFDPDACPKEYLAQLAYNVGFQIQSVDSEQVKREQIKRAVSLYKLKGTKESFEIIFVTLGYGIEVDGIWWNSDTDEYVRDSDLPFTLNRRWDGVTEYHQKSNLYNLTIYPLIPGEEISLEIILEDIDRWIDEVNPAHANIGLGGITYRLEFDEIPAEVITNEGITQNYGPLNIPITPIIVGKASAGITGEETPGEVITPEITHVVDADETVNELVDIDVLQHNVDIEENTSRLQFFDEIDTFDSGVTFDSPYAITVFGIARFFISAEESAAEGSTYDFDDLHSFNDGITFDDKLFVRLDIKITPDEYLENAGESVSFAITGQMQSLIIDIVPNESISVAVTQAIDVTITKSLNYDAFVAGGSLTFDHKIEFDDGILFDNPVPDFNNFEICQNTVTTATPNAPLKKVVFTADGISANDVNTEDLILKNQDGTVMDKVNLNNPMTINSNITWEEQYS